MAAPPSGYRLPETSALNLSAREMKAKMVTMNPRCEEVYYLGDALCGAPQGFFNHLVGRSAHGAPSYLLGE